MVLHGHKQVSRALRRLMLIGCASAAALLCLAIGCGSGSAEPPTGQSGREGTGSVRVVAWAGHPSGPRRFTLFAFPGYCSFGPKPYAQRVRVRHSSRGVILTLLMHFPPPAHPCLGEGIRIRKAIYLNVPVKRLTFFDGSQTPPARRWPR